MYKTIVFSFFYLLVFSPIIGQSDSVAPSQEAMDSVIIEFEGTHLQYSKKGVQKLWNTDETEVFKDMMTHYANHDSEKFMPLIDSYYAEHDSTWLVPLLYKSTFLMDDAISFYKKEKVEEGNQFIFEAMAICQNIEDRCLGKEKEVRMIAHIYSLCSPPLYEGLLNKLEPALKKDIETYIAERIAAIKSSRQ